MSRSATASLLQDLETSTLNRAQALFNKHPYWTIKRDDKILWYLQRKGLVRYDASKTTPRFWGNLKAVQNIDDAFKISSLISGEDFKKYTNDNWQGWNFAQIWAELKREGLHLEAEDAPEVLITPDDNMQNALTTLDYTPCHLPKLDAAQLSDVNKGLWELWGEDESTLKCLGLRARDPARDVREEWVAIDFGTSSTVVAVATPSGGKQLLRVGAREFNAPVEAKHYENPTVLEFLDLDAFLAVWNRQMYRPALDWNWVKAAHEALTDFRDHAKDPRMVGSVLRNLKRWVMEAAQVNTRLVDQVHSREYELAPLREYHPVRGQPMQAQHDALLDVIELYAWYLGMAINWRQRGIYLSYALTFPVKYPQEIKNKILASFSRGLQRSLPLSLVNQSASLNNFEVREIATEPMAYAVATLRQQGLAPSPEGLAYAVFDFGGGTTDFDYGLWRSPTPDEDDEYGVECVFERLGAGGDPYLGGENLLALLAYQLFQDNLKTVYEHKLLFTRPLSEAPFPGSEAVVDQSSIAQANSALVIQELRALLEQPETFSTTRLKLDLRNRAGEQVSSVVFELDVEALQKLIAERVARGVDGFLSEMQAAFAEEEPAEVHILLGGNASRGKWVREAFNLDNDSWIETVQRHFVGAAPQFVVHFAEGADDAHPDTPNCKTAVALGALDLVPGSAFLQKDRLRERSDGDAQFGYFVGPIKNDFLDPVFVRGAAYRTWHELGVIREGVFDLAWSSSPRARTDLKRGDKELTVKKVRFPLASKGWRCFGRVVAASEIELVAHPQGATPTENDVVERVALDVAGTGA